MRIHCLENVDKSLYFLSNLNVHLENIGAHDIVDGNARITLGLIWMIILRFQIQEITFYETVDSAGVAGFPAVQELRRYSKDALLLWCQMKTADYKNVDIQNFSTSWRDGLAFNALIHKHRPDLVDYQNLSPNTPLQNLESAFLTAEKKLGIARLFDPEDIYVQHPDEKSILTYVVTYYHYFNKLKSETVYARRADKFISYLKDIHDQCRWYEFHMSDLLAWILKTMDWINDHRFPNQIEHIQRLLTEFKNYRIHEKSAKLTEKGNIEMHLFTLQMRMRSVSMRIYRPPAELELSEVNRAWSDLEKAEHLRELALRDELMKQQRLLHLFNRFERKVKLRESWINDNYKLLDRCDQVDDLLTAEAALKKHEALETDVCAYADRIQGIHEIASELQQSCFYNIENVLKAREKVEYMWQQLLTKMSERFKKLEGRMHLFKRFSEIDHLKSLISRLTKKLQDNGHGDHLTSVEELLQRHELIETEIRSIHRSLTNILKTEFDQCKMVVGDKLDAVSQRFDTESKDLREAYSNLVYLAEERKRMLESSKSRFMVLSELDEHLYFMEEKILYLEETKLVPDNLNVNNLFKRHKAAERELEGRRVGMLELFDKAVELINQKCPDHMLIEEKLNTVKKTWDQLVSLMANRKSILLFLRDVQQFLLNCDDTETWIEEKHKLCFSTMDESMQSNNLSSTERLIRRHQETVSAIENFHFNITQLKEQGQNILDLVDSENAEIQQNIQSNVDMKANTMYLVKEKLDNVTNMFDKLESDAKKVELLLLDTMSLHKFFKMASTAYGWIVEKEACLRLLALDDPKKIELENLLANNGELIFNLLEKLQVIKRKFSDLEVQMNATADQVSEIYFKTNFFIWIFNCFRIIFALFTVTYQTK